MEIGVLKFILILKSYISDKIEKTPQNNRSQYFPL